MTQSDITYKTRIEKALSRLGTNGTENPDTKSNTGRAIGEAFLWDEVERLAKAKSKDAWAALDSIGLLTDEKNPGEYLIAESPSFAVNVRISEPVRRFDPDHLADLLLKKYKVPKSTTKQFVEASKLPAKSTFTYKIIEKV